MGTGPRSSSSPHRKMRRSVTGSTSGSVKEFVTEIRAIVEPAQLAAEKAHKSWCGDAAPYIDRIFSRTSNVQQQEASHDAEIFVKAVHAVDSICT